MKICIRLFIVLSIYMPSFLFAQQTSGPGTHVHEQARRVVYKLDGFPPGASGHIGICSFNIQWLGHWYEKDNQKIALALSPCDVAVIQEMVAPPFEVEIMVKKDEKITIKEDAESRSFFMAMKDHGFDGWLMAPEDTGPNKHHSRSTSSEWPIVFYKKNKVREAKDLPSGYISRTRVRHPVFKRVPYAFALRAAHDSVDFVLVSVHLSPKNPPDSDHYAKAKRAAEFQLISKWIKEQKKVNKERDFFVLGDMNLEDQEEYEAYNGNLSRAIYPHVTAIFRKNKALLGRLKDLSFKSLFIIENQKITLFPTNIRLNRPFDHVMYDVKETTIEVYPKVEILDTARYWQLGGYGTTRTFIRSYSDHNPIRFQIKKGYDHD